MRLARAVRYLPRAEGLRFRVLGFGPRSEHREDRWVTAVAGIEGWEISRFGVLGPGIQEFMVWERGVVGGGEGEKVGNWRLESFESNQINFTRVGTGGYEWRGTWRRRGGKGKRRPPPWSSTRPAALLSRSRRGCPHLACARCRPRRMRTGAPACAFGTLGCGVEGAQDSVFGT